MKKFLIGLAIGLLAGTLFKYETKVAYENGWQAGYAYRYRVPWNAKHDYLQGVKMGWWLHQARRSLTEKTLKKYGVK